MVPRGRPRKPGRADGAIEHMCNMGFDYDDICRELKTLLKVYGEDGWWFIESDSYKVLIDALLDAQERGAQPENGDGNGSLPEAETVDKNVKLVLKAADAGLNPHHLPSSSTVMEAAYHSEPDINEDGGFVIHDNPPLSPPIPRINNSLPPPVIDPPHIRRQPCYGWICDEDDGESEIIELTPALSAFQ